MNISGRVALVTGASQGIGRSCALKLASTGATVALAARNQEKLNELVREISGAGGKAATFKVDVSDEAQIKSACKAVITQFGKIDILVNNAGISGSSVGDPDGLDGWDRIIAVNQTSIFLGTKLAAEHAEAALGTDHQHRECLRADGPGGPGQLRGIQGGTDRAHHGHRPRSRIPHDNLQRSGAWPHRNRHDGWPRRRV